MADRQLTIDLLARDQTGGAPKRVADKLDNVADAADKADKSTDKLGKSTDRLSESQDRAKERIAGLDSNIKTIQQNLVFLHQAMGDAADDAERLDISKGIRRAEADIKRLSKSRDVLKGLSDEAEKAGRSFGTNLAQGISGGIGSVSGKLAGSVGPTVGGAIALAAAPVLMQTLATALSGGVGLGVLGVGIMSAVKNSPEIQTAGKQLGIKFVTGIQDAASDSLEGPIRESFSILESAGNDVVNNLGSAFKALGPAVKPLVSDLATVAQVLTEGLAGVASTSGPALAGLGDTMVTLASGVSDFITIVSDGGPEAASNLTLVAGAIADTVRYTGWLIDKFNDLSSNPWVTGGLLTLLRDHYKDASEATEEMAKKHRDAAQAAREQVKSLEELADELRAETDPAFRLLKAQTDLGEARTKLNKATKKYGENSAEARDELNKMVQASIELQSATGELGDSFNGRITPALRSNLEAAGFTKKEIGRLEKEFRQAKDAGDDFATTYTARAAVNGVNKAMTDLYTLQKIANRIDGRTIDIAVRITGASSAQAKLALGKQYEARAVGGPVRKGNAYIVGEHRPEIFVPDRDGKIIPSVEQYSRWGAGVTAGPGNSGYMMAPSGGGRWSGGRPMTLNVSGGSGSNDWLWQAINYGFRNGYISVSAGA